MKESIHKVKDDWVIFRYDEKEHDRIRNNKSEYWTWNGWKHWVKNAKLYRTEDDAAQALVNLRLLAKKNVWT